METKYAYGRSMSAKDSKQKDSKKGAEDARIARIVAQALEAAGIVREAREEQKPTRAKGNAKRADAKAEYAKKKKLFAQMRDQNAKMLPLIRAKKAKLADVRAFVESKRNFSTFAWFVGEAEKYGYRV